MATVERKAYVKERLAYSYLKEGATYLLDDDTTTAVMAHIATSGNKLNDFAGCVVAVTGDKEVGFGSDGDYIEGFISKIGLATVNDNDLYTVTVNFNQTMEKIPYSGSVAAGNWLVCDGTGKVKTSANYSGVKALSVDAVTTTCAVRVV